MKETYKLLSKILLIIIIGAIITTIFGVVAVYLGYNNITNHLNIKGACTIIYLIFGALTVCCAGYAAFKVKSLHIKKIRKNSGFLKAASYLAFAVIFFTFCFELVRIIIASYTNSFLEYFSTWRLLKLAFSLPCSLHFLFMALPTKLRRRRVKIPKSILYITSVSTVLWAVFGLLSAYFYNQLTTTNILKIWQIIIYLIFAVFFLFEIKFEHIKPSSRAYLFTSLLAFIASMAFTLTTIIGLISGIIYSKNSFSALELLGSLVIGIYALSRMFAIKYTIKYVMSTSDNSSHSSKFDKHGHHHHHHSSSSAEASEQQGDNKN
ncbi:MAG: hypothetical protein J6A95_04725 [Clostridia bacterium]|nr:hypothetical protein [Clostridia bacterium]